MNRSHYQLDDKNFEELMSEALALIPKYSREWTDFNPSDPGITLIELTAWLTETLLYRINQVPPKNYWAFLELLGITPEQESDRKDAAALTQAKYRAIRLLAKRHRLVTLEDHCLLAEEAMLEVHPQLPGKAVAIADRDLRGHDRAKIRPGQVSILLLPESEVTLEEEGKSIVLATARGRSTDALNSQIYKLLRPKRLLGHKLKIATANFMKIHCQVVLALQPNSNWSLVAQGAAQALSGFFDPLWGGPEGKGWPPGRSLYDSEVFNLLEGVEGVDYVSQLHLRDAYGEDISGEILAPAYGFFDLAISLEPLWSEG